MMSRRSLALWVGLSLGLLRAAAPAEAHGVNTSYSEITPVSDRLEVVHRFSAEDLFSHFPVNANGDGEITPEEYHGAMPGVAAFLAEHLTVSVDGAAEPLADGRYNSNGASIWLTFHRPLARPPSELALAADAAFFERFSGQHTHLVKVTVGDQILQAALSADHPRELFTVGRRSLVAQCAEFVKLGVEHIFLGYDHLMFLFALVIIGGRLGQLVKIVTAFTVAHSVTLILAALQVVSLPSRLIESGIALSIAYVALENFFITAAAHRWMLTFGFGLVHGFGFANVLREMGLPPRGLVPSLLSFNVGVELGQLAVVAVLFPATLWLARQRFRRPVVLAISGAVFLFGIGWFIERAFNLSFMPL